MASITNIHLPKVAFWGTAANLRSHFRERKFLKFRDTSLRRQQARATSLELCLCQISVYFPVHSRFCPRILYAYYHVCKCIYVTTIMKEAPRVMHFSAFIVYVLDIKCGPDPHRSKCFGNGKT